MLSDDLSTLFASQVARCNSAMEHWISTQSYAAYLHHIDRQNNLTQSIVQLEYLELFGAGRGERTLTP